jgi:hypothetical protein
MTAPVGWGHGSWVLRAKLLALGVPEDEAINLMNGHAHDLAERIRDNGLPANYVDTFQNGADWGADLIDPEAAGP